jgi:gamma-glutamylcyclotransferase (GGCT)/AIG2-like uncharacterized protein YtfP
MNAFRALVLSCLILAAGLGIEAISSSLTWNPRPAFFLDPWPSLVFLGLAILGLLWACSYWFKSSLSLKASWPEPRESLALILILAADFFLLHAVPYATPNAGSPWALPADQARTLAEELCVRILLFAAIRELWGEGAALWISTLWGVLLFLPFGDFKFTLLVALHSFLLSRLRGRSLFLLWLLLPSLAFSAALTQSLGLISLAPAAWVGLLLTLSLAIFVLGKNRVNPLRHDSLLFSYGSLRSGQREALQLGIPSHADSAGAARIQGKLENFEGYPRLRLDTKAPKELLGELLILRDMKIQERLDQYEGPGYERQSAEVRQDDLKLETWVYAAARKKKSRKSNL